MKWKKNSSEEVNTESTKNKISKRTGIITGKTVKVIKNTPSSTKNRLTASTGAFKDGFRQEVPAKELVDTPFES